jgi:hypothetical protein
MDRRRLVGEEPPDESLAVGDNPPPVAVAPDDETRARRKAASHLLLLHTAHDRIYLVDEERGGSAGKPGDDGLDTVGEPEHDAEADADPEEGIANDTVVGWMGLDLLQPASLFRLRGQMGKA